VWLKFNVRIDAETIGFLAAYQHIRDIVPDDEVHLVSQLAAEAKPKFSRRVVFLPVPFAVLLFSFSFLKFLTIILFSLNFLFWLEEMNE
jgi:hypothetical protein